MICDGDKIAVGVSGGKDSLTLLCAMKYLSRFHPAHFSVTAITLDTGLPQADLSPIKTICDQLEVELILEKAEIYKIVFELRKEKNPCSLCANLRRGALNDVAFKHGIKKIALGHHFDDAVETFFLNLYNEGRIGCFAPVTFLDRSGMTVIRPLIYVPEKEIRRFVKSENIAVMQKYCPADGHTNRENIKTMLAEREKIDKGFKERIFGAIERGNISGFKVCEKRKRSKGGI
ncbi:MAG: tRNA 2-thiocytidine biosynthesis TtcA family protein [Clostridia bacterium]